MRLIPQFASVMAFAVSVQAPVTVMLPLEHEWMVVRREDLSDDDDDDGSGPNGGLKIVRTPSAQVRARGVLHADNN